MISKYGRVLSEFVTECPFCGGPLTVTEVEYKLPRIGKALIVSKKCAICGYRRNDVVPLAQHKHTRVYFRVEKPGDFDVKVVRSPTARVIVPELGLELKPGVDAEMFVTNIEGVLQLFLDALERMKILDPELNTSATEAVLREIIAQRKGGFTVILDDESGLSTFYSEGVQEVPLLVEEVGQPTSPLAAKNRRGDSGVSTSLISPSVERGDL